MDLRGSVSKRCIIHGPPMPHGDSKSTTSGVNNSFQIRAYAGKQVVGFSVAEIGATPQLE
jgi:hypothetical protein